MAVGVKTRKVCLARAVSISRSSFCKGNKIVGVSGEITYSENVERRQDTFLKADKGICLGSQSGPFYKTGVLLTSLV
jgi:hypothetical protein